MSTPRELSIRLYAGEGHADYEIRIEGDRRVASSGRVRFSDVPAGAGAVELNAVRARCSAEQSGERCYQMFRALGFEYGTRLQVITHLAYGPGVVLARLELPPSARDDRAFYVLHPSLLDGALQSCLWSSAPENAGGVRWLPYGIGALEIQGALPAACWAYATRGADAGGVSKHSVRLLDDEGRVLVSIGDYTARAAARVEAADKSDALFDVFRKVESQTLGVAEAERLLGELALEQERLR